MDKIKARMKQLIAEQKKRNSEENAENNGEDNIKIIYINGDNLAAAAAANDATGDVAFKGKADGEEKEEELSYPAKVESINDDESANYESNGDSYEDEGNGSDNEDDGNGEEEKEDDDDSNSDEVKDEL